MKRVSLLLALLLVAGMSTTAYAQEKEPDDPSEVLVFTDEEGSAAAGAPVLKDVRVVSEDGQQRIIKTWEAAPGYDSEQLVEPDFQQNGFNYKKSYLLMVSENSQKQSKLASETVTVSHEQKDGAIARLAPLLDYDQDGYQGQLQLDAASIYTEAAGKQNYTYAVTDTREYTGMDRNDTYNIPKNITKNGTDLQLVDVDWTELGDGNYRALASYRGTATGVSVSGYISTATYLGEVQKNTLDSVTYAVVYEGSPIPLPPPDYLPYVLTSVGVVTLSGCLVLLWNKRKNARIYALIDGQYRVVQRVKVSYIDPIIDLTAPSLGGISRDYLVVIDRFAAKRLNNQFIRVICADGTVKEHRMVNNGYGCKLKVGAVAADEFEEA
ncbi:hypothetical protein CE91St46_10870 [Eubacteriales bacterium]|uniref:hypothetical protein n=1 Tax=Anaerotruncus TaxID=244127 RepID=UPI000E551E05|nr:hypothetical protein [Anaerotruncus sp. AF02-27]MCM0707200.1 hypothetical protein [Faecalicatena sp. BF-R-105]GKH48138.1 hypothetical protein CE91St45_27000 [Oscillospiraceae bacterium]GKH49976.1 hypothetical protein CE91St46_10870 [Eubacteriales bacterium]RGX53441.1 hypothetical protein DWV16_16725 [Anaerotruncus sp. AF02-27]GKH62612.1 hypothetical protein CE91St47_10810 [Eubacteriales bacterium]